MNKITQTLQFIQSLNKKEFQKYLLMTISSIAILALGTTYYVYHKSSNLTSQIRKLNLQTNKIAKLLSKNQFLETEEIKIQELLKSRPDFNMNTYFEQFYTKHNLKPEPNWKPEEGSVIEGSQAGISYQEIVLKAVFKNQTMQTLVTVLQDIYKEPIVYLKELEITAEKSKINFELTLATKKYKTETKEAVS
jgi:hypothetical protein